jgi:AcrR family transcriptional regulator
MGHGRAKGVATQSRILERAVHIASIEGLSQMSLATLARATDMSKSGLFAHFRSKEALQLAIIDEADRLFDDAVVHPGMQSPQGLQRLAAWCRHYVKYSAGQLFEGGCFFAAAAHEFDGKPGAIRDRIVSSLTRFSDQLTEAAQAAKDAGDMRADVDVKQLVFEIVGVTLSCNWTSQLYRDHMRSEEAGLRAMNRLLRDAATDTGLRQLVDIH